jgi:hypothetical protein
MPEQQQQGWGMFVSLFGRIGSKAYQLVESIEYAYSVFKNLTLQHQQNCIITN